MVWEAAQADSYNGTILSMNVSGATKPNKQLVQPGILDAWLSASPKPTIILLQEFSYPNKELEKSGGVLDALEKASGNPWRYTRQWSGTGQRDTVVLYSATEFQGRAVSTKYMKEASSTAEINKIFVGRKLNKAKKKVISYTTRWAGVQLAPLLKSTPDKLQASRVQFLIICYHGRERREQAQESSSRRKKSETDGVGEVESAKYKGTSLKSPIEKLLARDFIAEVARTSMDCNFLFDAHKDGMNTKFIPALISGDWNAEIDLLENFTGFERDPSWTCSHHAPTRAQPHLSVRKTSDGELKADIDYVVAINPKHDHELSCEIEVSIVEALVHKKSYRDNNVFDHDPLLVQFCVKPRYPNGKVSSLLDERPPKRVAALLALANIRRLSGKEMKERAKKYPLSAAIHSIRSSDFEEDTNTSATVSPSPVEGERVAIEEEEQVNPPPPPPPPLSPTEERTIALFRCPKSYNLRQNIKDYTRTELKAAVKAMALDALGVHPRKKIKKEHAALEQFWWPTKVTKRSTTEFDSLNDAERFTLYGDLHALLLAKGIGAEVVPGELAGESRPTSVEEGAPAQSNILPASGLGSRMKRLFSLEKVRKRRG